MQKPKVIEHEGVISNITTQKISITILAKSACAHCDAKGSCSLNETEEKLLEVANPHKDYQIGQKVKVVMQQSLGFRALFLGYVLPFVILVVVLFIAMEITQNDLFSGLLGLATLIPYYLILYLMKDKLQKTFAFSLK